MIDLAITTGLVGIVLFIAAIVIWVRQKLQQWSEDGFGGGSLSVPSSVMWVALYIALLFFMCFLAGILGLLLWFAAIYIGVFIAARLRRADQQILVWWLTAATKTGIPLATAARSFSRERNDRLGKRAAKLATALEQGKSLDAALVASGIRLPDDALVALRMDADTGMLHRTLESATTRWSNFDMSMQGFVGQVAYLLICLGFIAVVMAFLEIKIVPAFVKILSDFHLQGSAAPWLLVNHSMEVRAAGFLALLGCFFVTARYIGLIRWDPPIVRRWWREVDEATVLRSLALAVDRQRPLPATLAELAKKHPRAHVRTRLDDAASRAAAGSNWCDALQSAGLLESADAGVLRAAERVGNLNWALNETADRLLRRFFTRLTAVTSIGFPLLLLMVAAVVCMAALSVFIPLVTIISKLAL